jgi:hypothetical protein
VYAGLHIKGINAVSFRTTIDKYEKNTVLTVRRVTRADSGKYKLILTNGSGTCESVADVVVLGKHELLSSSFRVL